MKQRYSSLPGRLQWRLLSIPIFIKTLGIGAIVATLFGGTLFIRTRQTLTTNLYEVQERRVKTEARLLASYLQRPATVHDIVRIQDIIDESRAANPDILYIIVRDDAKQVIAHTFGLHLPAGLIEAPPDGASAAGFRILKIKGGGLAFEVQKPLVKGYAGYLQLAVSDRMVREQVHSLSTSILSALLISIAIGVGLAAFLSYLITKPIQHLKKAAGKIQQGDFESRSLIYSDDEIGELAMAFNDMADSLRSYREEVKDREETRLALIERVVSSHENERKLISRELHDHFGQSLLAVLVDIRAARDRAGSSTPVLQKLEKAMEKIVGDLSRIVRGMRPTVLDDYGLDRALESYTRESAERYQLEISYKYTAPPDFRRLPGHIEVTLYRIAQEAITNIIKHAGATHVSLVLLITAQSTILLVEDDGKGFDPAVSTGKGGLGLVGMRERMSLIGGQLDFISSGDEGTTIRATIPNPREHEDGTH